MIDVEEMRRVLGTYDPKPAPLKNCDACEYRQPGMRDGGHCYMFEHDFDNDRCGAFRPI